MEIESDGGRVRTPDSGDEFTFSVDGAERPKASHGRSPKESKTPEQTEPIRVPSAGDHEPNRLVFSPHVASPAIHETGDREREPEVKSPPHESRSSSRKSVHTPAIDAPPPEATPTESRRSSAELPVMLQAIRNASSEGCALLRHGKAHEASHKFQHAYKYAKKWDEIEQQHALAEGKQHQIEHESKPEKAAGEQTEFAKKASYTKRQCALNLAAALIAERDPKRALKYLKIATPPSSLKELKGAGRDSPSNGDLHYNMGLAFDQLDELARAEDHLRMALEEYLTFEPWNAVQIAIVQRRLAELHERFAQWSQAAQFFEAAADSWGKCERFAAQLSCLVAAVHSYEKLHTEFNSNQALDKCVALLGAIESGGAAAGRARLRAVHAGALYNDLGLAYMRNRQFPRAAECFEQALPHLRAERRLDLVQKFEPLVEQNLGASYNAVGDYQRALPFHKRALERYVERGDRAAEASTLLNLALAHWQLGDSDSAYESYLHAYRAAESQTPKDQRTAWQSLEALGVICALHSQKPRAVDFLKRALLNLPLDHSGTSEEHERLVGELCAALELTMAQPDADAAAEPSVEFAASLGAHKAGGLGSKKLEGAMRRFLPPHAYTHLSSGFVVEDERYPYPVEEPHRPQVRDVLLEGTWPEWLREETLETPAPPSASASQTQLESSAAAASKSMRREEAAAASEAAAESNEAKQQQQQQPPAQFDPSIEELIHTSLDRTISEATTAAYQRSLGGPPPLLSPRVGAGAGAEGGGISSAISVRESPRHLPTSREEGLRGVADESDDDADPHPGAGGHDSPRASRNDPRGGLDASDRKQKQQQQQQQPQQHRATGRQSTPSPQPPQPASSKATDSAACTLL